MTDPNVRRIPPTPPASRAAPDRGSAVRVYRWQWGPDEQRRPGLPWIGIFLLVFGGLLLLERFVPALRFAGSAFLLAAASCCSPAGSSSAAPGRCTPERSSP